MLSDKLSASKHAAALEPAAKEAIEWEVRLRSGDSSSREREQFEAWHNANPLHADAWLRLQQHLSKLAGLQGTSGRAVRQALNEPVHARRALLKAGAGVATLLFVGVGARHLVKTYSLDADYHNGGTAVERVALTDDVAVTMGVSTRIYTGDYRQGGDIYLASGQIIAGGARRLVVSTRDGRVEADRARVSVDSLSLHTVVAVEGGDAIIHSRVGGPMSIPHGSVWSIRPDRVGQMPETSTDVFSWTQGLLVVLDRAVPDLLDTFRRYFPGLIRFPDSVQSRRVSGVFPLNDIETALHQLADALGLTLGVYGKALAVAT